MVTEISSLRKLYPFESRFYDINGHKYHYVDEGEGDPVVMVHGNPSWSFLYRDVIKGLRNKYRMVAPDHLGFGLSDKPTDFHYRLETHIDNFEAFMLHLDLKNITLIVHDWGGPIGLGFASRHPERIKKLVISNTAAFASNNIPWRIAAGKIPWLGRKMIVNFNLFLKSALTMTVEKPLPQEVKDAYLMPFQNKESRIGIARFVEDIPMGPLHPSFEVLLGVEHSLWMFRKTPVAIMWGMKDWCFSPKFYDRWLDIYPHAELLPLKNAGHWLYEDAIEDILPFLQHFLSE